MRTTLAYSLNSSLRRSMVKKWQTLIEGNVDVKTTDGYMLRVFCIGFTKKNDMSTKKTCYAQSAQVKNIRKKMTDIITREVTKTDLKGVVNKLIPDSIATDIATACQGEIDKEGNCIVYTISVFRNLSSSRCAHQESQGAQEAQVRPDQADGPAR